MDILTGKEVVIKYDGIKPDDAYTVINIGLDTPVRPPLIIRAGKPMVNDEIFRSFEAFLYYATNLVDFCTQRHVIDITLDKYAYPKDYKYISDFNNYLLHIYKHAIHTNVFLKCDCNGENCHGEAIKKFIELIKSNTYAKKQWLNSMYGTANYLKGE